jgi:hypothetical protein
MQHGGKEQENCGWPQIGGRRFAVAKTRDRFAANGSQGGMNGEKMGLTRCNHLSYT